MNNVRIYVPHNYVVSALFVLSVCLLSACNSSKPEVDTSYAYRPSEDWNRFDAPDVYGETGIEGDIFTLQASPSAAQEGVWSPTADWPIGAIHAIVTPDGNILTYGASDTDTSDYGGGGFGFSYDVWDPDNGLGAEAHITLENETPTNIFCSAQLILPNGQILLTGGNGEENGIDQLGINDVTQFDYSTNRLTTFTANGSPLTMLKGRWYPTLTTLPNGDQLVHGGRDDTPEKQGVIYPEIFDQSTQSWKLLDDPANKASYEDAYGGAAGWYYPQSWVAPDGRVLMLNGFTRDFRYLDVNDGSIEIPYYLEAGRDWDHRLGGVMFEQGKILAFANAQDAMIVDINEEITEASVEDIADLEEKRIWGETTVLADGQVLISGGGELDENQGQASAEAAVTYTELWNPKTKIFTKGPSAEQIRLYHSTAILMPNGAVLTAGGGWPGPVDNYNAEIYYPPYLFDASGEFAERPILGNVSKVDWGKAFNADVNSASTISRVTLVRSPSITHSFDMGQLFYELDFTQVGSGLTIEAPANANVAPPGFYMLFAFDDKGVPSKAQMIHIADLNKIDFNAPNVSEIVVNNPGKQISAANSPVNLQILAHNLKGESLTYRVENNNLPSGLKLDSKSGLISGVPDTPGEYEVQLEVSRAGTYIGVTFNWTITEGAASIACSPNVQSAADAALSGDFAYSGGYVHVPESADGYGYFNELNTEHRAEFCVNVDEAGEYRIKGSVSASSEEDNSFYVKLDGADLGVWDVPVTNGFEDAYVVKRGASAFSTDLSAGEHRITLYQREKGTRLAEIGLELLTESETTCGALVQEAEDGALFGNFTLGTSATASGGQFATVPADAGFVWQGPSSSQARYCVTAPTAGSYELKASAASESEGSFFVTLNAQPSAGYIWDVPSSTSFKESTVSARGEAMRLELEKGKNILTFHQREAGVSLDKFELVKK